MDEYKFIGEKDGYAWHGNTEHHKIYDIGCGENVTLHRFKNASGVEWSGIYIYDLEFGSVESQSEAELVAWYKGKFGSKEETKT